MKNIFKRDLCRNLIFLRCHPEGGESRLEGSHFCCLHKRGDSSTTIFQIFAPAFAKATSCKQNDNASFYSRVSKGENFLKCCFVGLIALLILIGQLPSVHAYGASQKAYRFASKSAVGDDLGIKNSSIMRTAPEYVASLTWRKLGRVAWFPPPPDGADLGVGDMYSRNVVITGDGYPAIDAVVEVNVEREIEMSWGGAVLCVWKIAGMAKAIDEEGAMRMRNAGLRSISVRGGGTVLLSKKGFVPEVAWMDLFRTGQPDIWADVSGDDVDLGSHSIAWAAMQ